MELQTWAFASTILERVWSRKGHCWLWVVSMMADDRSSSMVFVGKYHARLSSICAVPSFVGQRNRSPH